MSKRPLTRRPMSMRLRAIDLPAAGLGFGLVALVAMVTILGVVPTALTLGLLALLVVD